MSDTFCAFGNPRNRGYRHSEERGQCHLECKGGLPGEVAGFGQIEDNGGGSALCDEKE